MALATLELCFMNEDIFEGTVKIGRGEAVGLMMEARDGMDSVAEVFLRYVRRIKEKNDVVDPSFEGIRSVCDDVSFDLSTRSYCDVKS